MAVKFGDAPCVDPIKLYDECLRSKTPIGDWWKQANHFKCPLGHLPGTGIILLRKGDIDRLGIDDPHDLVFSEFGTEVRIRNVLITSAKCVTPGARDDPNAVYQVQIADARHTLGEIILGQRYNMVQNDGDNYQEITVINDTDSDSDSEAVGYRAYTWQEMLDSIWSLASLNSTTPTLDPVPHGTPENFDFDTDSALYGLGVVLDRLGLALRWTPWAESEAFDIVTIGDELTDSEDLEVTPKARRFDSMSVWGNAASIPGSVRVVFAVCPPSCTYGPTCAVTVSRPNPPADEVRNEAAQKVIFDDLIGRYSTDGTSDSDSDSDSDCSGSGCTGMTNSTALLNRACERARDYYRMLVDGGQRFLQVLDGAHQIRPNARYKVVSWEDRGQGVVTTVYGGPDVLRPLELWHQWHRKMAERNLCGCDDYIEEDYITGFCLVLGEPEPSSDSESAA
jgi:hypothetical protein